MNEFVRKDQAPFCACGCGKKVKWSNQRKRWNKYIFGHQMRGRKWKWKSYGKKRNHWASIRKVGEKNPMWRGGIAAEPYCDIWLDNDFKQFIRARDNNKCQNPDCRHNCDNMSLHLHHINYDKKNCHPWNLITVCKSCNFRANFKRGYWSEFYKNIMTEKYGYNYMTK